MRALLGVLTLFGCDPNAPQSALLAVHTGTQWAACDNGTQVTVLRDNPPLTGFLDFQGSQYVPGMANPTSVVSRAFVYNGVDYIFDTSYGHTFRDSLNGDGWLSFAPVGNVAQNATLIRWHSNGLQLDPGTPVNLHLSKKVFQGMPYSGQWVWQGLDHPSGSVVLDPRTRIVGVHIMVIQEPGVTTPFTTESLAQLWIDGRAVDRTSEAESNGGSYNANMIDEDPRSSLTATAGSDPGEGRNGQILFQEPDAVWSVCGERYGQNIQFRMTAFDLVRSDIANANCATAAASGSASVEYCISTWAQASAHPSPGAIQVAIVRNYSGSGVAQTWQEGIVFGENALSNIGANNPQNTLAHEIGHFLGWNTTIFFDGSYGPSNLMADHSRNLTSDQCAAAYAAALNHPAQ